MNVFKALASGWMGFREEFMSAFIAYLLHPGMDHGLGSSFLATMLSEIADHDKSDKELADMCINMKDLFRENLLSAKDNKRTKVQVEVDYGKGNHRGRIDIVVKCNGWFFVIENKT